jgi:hypothetical protein
MAEQRHKPVEEVSWIGLEAHYKWLELVVWAVLALNLADALLTLAWIRMGVAKESNPLLARLIEFSPWLFVLVKTSTVTAGSLLLWRLRGRPFAVVMIFAMFIVYYSVLLFHLSYLGGLWSSLHRAGWFL